MPTTVMTNPVVWEVPATAAPSTRALLREPFPEAVRGLTFTPAAPGLWRGGPAHGPFFCPPPPPPAPPGPGARAGSGPPRAPPSALKNHGEPPDGIRQPGLVLNKNSGGPRGTH